MPTPLSTSEKSDRSESILLTISSIAELKDWLSDKRKQNKTIGFVPTMGALHYGHISLVNKAKEENDIVVVSIFVNPTQFNNDSDLENYPRTPERDIQLLAEIQTDVLFFPSKEEMYKDDSQKSPVLDIGNLGTVMEGEHRPGHFAGVIQIVSRLFDIMDADKAYFGEKDFQQLAVIRFMTKKMGYKTEIIGCQTVREPSGLAMSSRNLNLSEKGLRASPNIYQVLLSAKAHWQKYIPALLKQHVKDSIEKEGFLKVEYIEIADEVTLQPLTNWEQFEHCRIFAVVFCEGVRLIDNIRLF